MKKIKAWQRSRKLALGIAFALGCSMAVSVSAAEIAAPITGDAETDTAFADYITSNSSSTTYNFDKDITIKVDSEVNAPLQLTAGSNSYDIVHGIAATKTNATYLYLNPKGNTITVDVTAHGDTIGAGIFASDAKQTINTSTDSSGNYNITVTGSADNTQKSYGIWRAITNTTSKSFYVNLQRDEVGDATININVKNDNGGYGVAVSTPDGADMVKSNGSSVTISGNVNASVSENKKAASVLDNSAGLYVDTTNSKITINGKANLDVAGNGIVLNTAPGSSKIEVTKGGVIKVAPSTDGSERYAIYDNGGIVYFGGGSVGGLNGYTGAVAKGNGTQIDGDVYLGDSAKTIFWLALSGDDAYLKGAIKEAGEFGNVSMALNDGAVWYNSAANSVNKGTATVITKLAGNNGLVYQSADSGDVTLKDLWSNSLNIAYEHDATDPSKILGGSVTIEKASADNTLNVFTDYDANMNTATTREAVLNALANKIYYTGYISGEDNIDGYVSIAEGLTTSSATKYFADMSFDETTGQGYVDKDTEVREAKDAGEQTQAEFDKAILGSTVNKGYYKDAGVYKEGVYNFTKDTTITPENNSVVAGPWLNKFASGIFSSYNDEAVTVDMNGHKLTLKNITDQSTTGMAAVGPTGKVEINNAGAMDIYAESTTGQQTAALFVNGGGQLFIHNGGEDVESKILTLHGKTTNSTNGAVVKSMNGAVGERSWLKIDGLVDIEADTTDGVGMAEGLSAVASTIEIGGGRIIMSASGVNPGLNFGDNATNCAIRAYGEFVTGNRAIVNVNVIKDEDTATGNAIAAGNNRTQINGNFNTVGGMGTKGTINVGLNTADSYWIGNYINGAGWGMTPGDYGAVNLFMSNGAQWKGYSKFATNVQMDSGATWEGYSLNKAVSLSLKNGATTGEDNILSFVSINDSLKGNSTQKRVGSVSFDETTGQGQLDWVAAAAQTKLAYDEAITGNLANDINYVKDGVMDIESKEYSFTKANTTLTVDSHNIAGGPWIASIGAAISGADGTNVKLNLNGNRLNVTGIGKSHSTGIAAIGTGTVEINNAGAMSITANGGGQTAALFANGGGQLTIHNGDGDLEKKVLTVRANATNKANGAVIKTMNGKNGVTSNITIDGLVDVLADGVNSNEAVSAVASTIDIGGGRIEAQGDAWAAIRAYGEFVSTNVGTVNFNVVKDADGKAIGAGDKRAVVIGDVVTNGGMGTRGQINMGFSGENSYWEGNYADNVGYGVTPDQLGSVNVFLEDGAHWKGFGNGSMNVQLEGAKTNWYGFNTSEKMALTLKNGATWYNAITADQTDTNGNIVSAKVGYLTADNGFIDMTGDRVFKAEGKSLSGSTTQGAASWITESENGITGDVVINNYDGNATVIYKHVKDKDGISISGGNFTIKNAVEGSKITLSTDNDGIDTSSPDEVQDTLNKLANKLIYTGAIEGTESNLDGYVQIAEGLTSSSAALKVGNIDFSAEDGKGSLQAGSVVTPDNQKNPDIIYGDKETAMMKGAKTAMASSALMWRNENNDLMKRMGDLRLSEGESGIWAKYYGGKYSMDGQNTDLSLKYNAYQVGFDKEVGNGWLAGVALSYNDGSSSYGSGRADLKGTSLGIYGTWQGEDGQYVDLIAKYTRLENEFDVRNAYGHKLSGDYKTWGASLSVEYGKRFEMDKGFYVDPSVELTLGRIAAKDYTAGSDYLDSWGKDRSLSVEQDAFTSFIGRVGVRLGQKTDTARYFVKLVAAQKSENELMDFDIDAMTVEAKRPDWESKLSPGTMNIVRPDDFKGEQKTLPDLLLTVPCVHVREVNGKGQYTTVTMRGSTAAQVGIFIDGVLANLGGDTAVDLSTIPVKNVERVEVYRGYIPSRFGGTFMGGVINIVTKKPETTNVSLELGKSSYGGKRGSMEITAPLGSGSLMVATNYESSDGDFKYKNYAADRYIPIGQKELAGFEQEVVDFNNNNIDILNSGIIKLDQSQVDNFKSDNDAWIAYVRASGENSLANAIYENRYEYAQEKVRSAADVRDILEEKGYKEKYFEQGCDDNNWLAAANDDWNNNTSWERDQIIDDKIKNEVINEYADANYQKDNSEWQTKADPDKSEGMAGYKEKIANLKKKIKEAQNATRYRKYNDYEKTSSIIKWQNENWMVKASYNRTDRHMPDSVWGVRTPTLHLTITMLIYTIPSIIPASTRSRTMRHAAEPAQQR